MSLEWLPPGQTLLQTPHVSSFLQTGNHTLHPHHSAPLSNSLPVFVPVSGYLLRRCQPLSPPLQSSGKHPVKVQQRGGQSEAEEADAVQPMAQEGDRKSAGDKE